MTKDKPKSIAEQVDEEQLSLPVKFDFGMHRRGFVQIVGTGLLIALTAENLFAQRAGRGGGNRSRKVAARILVGKDGLITVLTGKIEMGQGARAELAQGAAEELRVPVDQITMIMGDTSIVPDDGLSAGSRTTPSTLPDVRRGAAAARDLLVALACRKWGVESNTVEVQDGKIRHASSNRQTTYAELASTEELKQAFESQISPDVKLTPVNDWVTMGKSVAKPTARAIVRGSHQFPSDLTRPGMLYGKVLRSPTYGANLVSIDLEPAKAIKDVVAVKDGNFVGVAAPTTHQARLALEAIAKTAKWETAPHPASKDIFAHLKSRAQGNTANPFADDLAQAKKVLKQTYHVSYVQHAPMETRVALAEWKEDSLTVWTGTQNPFGYHSELARTFRLPTEKVRVVIPDFGGGFGGKHTGEAAIEAARLARAAQKPVLVKWTREEEFTWAYFRPAGVLEMEAALDEQGKLSSWHFVNINSGGAAIDTPYHIPKARSRSVGSNAPLRQGSYRALASTANNFARECFMDELALAAGADPLDFRLAHLDNPRLRAVLETAAKRFDWKGRKSQTNGNKAIGLACGTEKGSYVAACVELNVDQEQHSYKVTRLCEVFECGAIVNPANLLTQVQACIIMGMGAALREEMRFEDGKMLNPFFRKYLVPRFEDLPEMDIHLLNRPDLDPIGGGETPIIAIAPAIANAMANGTGIRIRQMPIRLPGAKEA